MIRFAIFRRLIHGAVGITVLYYAAVQDIDHQAIRREERMTSFILGRNPCRVSRRNDEC